MLRPAYKTKFSRDLKRIIKLGYDIEKLKTVIDILNDEEPLNKKYLDHLLKGNYSDCRELHID